MAAQRNIRNREKAEQYWPLRGSVYAPTDYTISQQAQFPPNTTLQLEYIFGYRGYDCRDNLFLNLQNHLVFNCAAVCIVFDAENKTQRFYTEHTDDITCLAMHPKREIFASGQVVTSIRGNRNPKICVWNSITMETLAVLEGFHDHAICALAFNSEGNFVISIGTDDHNSICVYDWKKKEEIANAYGHSSKIFSVKSDPRTSHDFISCGVKHIKFWNINNSLLHPKQRRHQMQSYVSAAFTKGGEIVTGTDFGDLILWKDQDSIRTIKGAHHGPINALTSSEIGLISGGKDGFIKIWDESLSSDNPLVLDLVARGYINRENSSIKAIAWTEGKIFFGTSHSEIYELQYDLDFEKYEIKANLRVVLSGHFNELWGLDCHPEKDVFASGGNIFDSHDITTGNDKSVRTWNVLTKTVIKEATVDDFVKCLCYSGNGRLLAAGLNNGSVWIMDSESLDPLHKLKERTSRIDVVRFSPDCSMLAVGTQDSVIDIYKLEKKTCNRIAVLKGHSSAVDHLDWSEDGRVLQSDSASFEHLYWDISQMSQIVKTSTIRDINWKTWTCVLGWHVKGVWPSGDEIHFLSRSPDKCHLVCASDKYVKLYRFPCQQGAKSRTFAGHSSHVTAVQWSCDSGKVFSIGGNDRTIFQWHVVNKNQNSNKVEYSDQEVIVHGTPTDDEIVQQVNSSGEIPEINIQPAPGKKEISETISKLKSSARFKNKGSSAHFRFEHLFFKNQKKKMQEQHGSGSNSPSLSPIGSYSNLMNIVEEKPKEEVNIKEEEVTDESKGGIDDYIFDFDDMIVKDDVDQTEVLISYDDSMDRPGRNLKIPGIVVSAPDDDEEDEPRSERISEKTIRELTENQRNLQIQMKEMKKSYEYQIGELKSAISEMQVSMTYRLNSIEELLLKLIAGKKSSNENNVATKTSAKSNNSLSASTPLEATNSEKKETLEISTPNSQRRRSGTIIGTEKLQENSTKTKATKTAAKSATETLAPKEIAKTGSLRITHEDNNREKRRSISNLIGLWDKK